MEINDKINDGKLQHDINTEVAKISALSSEKYCHLIRADSKRN